METEFKVTYWKENPEGWEEYEEYFDTEEEGRKRL